MSGTPDILKRILAVKTQEIEAGSRARPLARLRVEAEGLPPTRDFAGALQKSVDAGKAAVIAEIKKASPSAGMLREDFDVPAIAKSYAAGGASCLSILTDAPFFQGRAEYLREGRTVCELPVLRKDFVVDPWQVYESRVLGADCILLIVSALGDAQLAELTGLATGLGMDVLIEVHDERELQRALELKPPFVGINNRNLHNFHVELSTTLDLLDAIPEDCLVVTESGINSHADVAHMREQGVNAFLVGEAFMRAVDPGTKLKELFGG